MAGSFSDYLELALLDHVFGKTNAYTAPVTLYLGLFTVTPADAGGGTEVTGGSYARKAVTNNTTNFPNATGATATKRLNIQTDFVTATADWGTVVAYGIFDAASAGNLLAWGSLTANKTVSNGDTASFAVDALSITLD